MSSWLSPVESVTWDSNNVSVKLTPDILKTSHPVRFYFVECGQGPPDASGTTPEGKWFRVYDKSSDPQFPTTWSEPTYPPKSVDESSIPTAQADIVREKSMSPEIDEVGTIEPSFKDMDAQTMAITTSTPGRHRMLSQPFVVPDNPPPQKKRRPASQSEDQDLVFMGERCNLTRCSPEPPNSFPQTQSTGKSRRSGRRRPNGK